MSAKRSNTPCKFCQQSRWVMTLVLLAAMMAVAALNLSGGL